jgi:hypothetical protein
LEDQTEDGLPSNAFEAGLPLNELDALAVPPLLEMTALFVSRNTTSFRVTKDDPVVTPLT